MRDRLRLAARVAAATALAWFVAVQFDLPQAWWAVITALLVVQASLGGSIATGIDRVLGTMLGAVVGAVAAWAYITYAFSLGWLLPLTVAPLALIAAKRATFRVAPVTAVIVLLATTPGQSPFLAAGERIAEIMLGTIIGVLVSLTFLPTHASRQLLVHAADTVALLGDLAAAHLASPRDLAFIEELQAKVRAGLTALSTATTEAKRERIGVGTPAPDPTPIVRTVRRLRSDVAILDRVAHQLSALPADLVAEAAAAARDALHAKAARLRAGERGGDYAALDTVIAKLNDAPGVLALSFAAETLRRDLIDLADRASEQREGKDEITTPEAG
ncbi:FUSC family protein [Roseiterribacter gracilis]|uniref:FUSC family protein n=1 Tax=Roseiterribacter gracilis TaxID=2812848 RepID=A0A8S8XHG0_9PROT|nr:hypothetical protein TMPK1_35660 [Rhodospirillales bacterium TMPK1]